jgi:catechol 2,3-dioxygenase-like lactoylglutathione lyase family enzyme
MIKIILTSVFVNDQDKALKFYTETLGFVKKTEFPAGKFKWLTVVSPDNLNGVELTLEPNDNPLSSTFQKGLFESGIPATAFGVDDIQKEYERMKDLGVVFKTKPTKMGPVTIAVFEDTCGNLIQLVNRDLHD